MKKPSPSRPLQVRVHINAQGFGGVSLNDIDISRYVAGIEVKTHAGKPSEVRLLLPPCDATFLVDVDAANLLHLSLATATKRE